MDGTLCDSRNCIPAATLAALADCRRAGLHIAVLTGRRRITLEPKLAELYAACEPGRDKAADTGPLWMAATNSGGLVWSYPGWELLAATVMPATVVQQIADCLAPHSLNVHVNPATSGGLELLHLRREPNSALTAYHARFGQRARELTAAADLLRHDVTMFAVPGSESHISELARRLRTTFAPTELTVLTLRWPLLDTWALEAYPPALSKAHALAAMAARLDIPRAAVAAAGDDVNDIPMLAWAGYSAAMPQAPESVVAAADRRLEGQGVAALADWLTELLELACSGGR
jgi:hydroxymethylpyrimidine pyrophosphatase-like HAD family hydrolase